MSVYCFWIDIDGCADVNFVMCWTEVRISVYCLWIDNTDCTDVNIPTSQYVFGSGHRCSGVLMFGEIMQYVLRVELMRIVSAAMHTTMPVADVLRL